MSGMKRFVSYIYSYENGEKRENVGFAKIELRAKEGRMELHLKGTVPTQRELQVNMFIREQEEIAAVRLGEVKLQGGRGDFFTIFEIENVGGVGLNFWKMEGILLLADDKSVLLSRWKEGEGLQVNAGQIHMWERRRVQEETFESRKQMSEEKTEEQSSLAESSQSSLPPVNEAETVHATELPVRNIYPQCDWQTCWQFLRENHDHFVFGEKTTCVKIELKHIRELPRRYWYLGNNSFLLHGFFNYRHLVVGKTEEEVWFIGVPGIYQSQERVMAAIFGFPEFLPEPVENRFGYWYRIVEE